MQSTWSLIHGDCLRVLPTLADASVDAIVTDPPYSSKTSAGHAAAPRDKYMNSDTRSAFPDFLGDNRDQRSWTRWCYEWMSESYRVARPSAPLLVFTDYRQLPSATDALQAAGWIWRGIIPWDKTEAARPVRGGFRMQAEFVLWATKGSVSTESNVYLPGVLRHRIPGPGARQHMTAKPLELMEQLVQLAPEGGLVLDLFAGSGTTGAAALRRGRRFLGVELSQHYAEVARARLQAA